MGIVSFLALITPFINIVLALVLAPLLDGYYRKVRAKLQNRIGPPITQTLRDIIKLLNKETLKPEGAHRVFIVCNVLALAFALTASVIVPTISPYNRLAYIGDVIVLFYLITASSILTAYAAAAIESPYTRLGSGREVTQVFFAELFVAAAIATLAVKYGTLIVEHMALMAINTVSVSTILAAILLFVALLIEGSIIPYDVPEAKTEIIGGVLAEFSGKLLAYAEYTILIRRFVIASLIANLTTPSIGNPIIYAVLYFVKLIVIYTVAVVVEVLNARYRIHSLVDLLQKLSILALIVPLIAVLGY